MFSVHRRPRKGTNTSHCVLEGFRPPNLKGMVEVGTGDWGQKRTEGLLSEDHIGAWFAWLMHGLPPTWHGQGRLQRRIGVGERMGRVQSAAHAVVPSIPDGALHSMDALTVWPGMPAAP